MHRKQANRDNSGNTDVEISPASSSNADRIYCEVDHEPPRARSREATVYFRNSVDERFLKGPIVVPPKKHSKWQTIVFAYQTFGIVYGDLGTSPLYVYPSITCSHTPDELDYLGILSLIFWTLTLIGIIKYTFIVLYADDHGEGGTFAMYSLLCQHTNVGGHARKLSQWSASADSQLSHFHKAWEDKKTNKMRKWLEHHKTAQKVLLFVVMLGTCMLIGDGILTPAISVLSAIGGIQTAVPSISQNIITWVSAVILVLLFLFQSYGTNKVSFLFSPVMSLWLLTTPIVGIYNIVMQYPKVFKAFSPYYIYTFFQKNGKEGWMMLGGVVLCITGSEAMFADMGHFNRLSIQMAFTLGVYPAVLLTYSGQTAYLINHPDEYLQGFFNMIPTPVFWPMFVISTLAAVVASQGLITATFSVVKQSVALDYFPPVKVVHTSEDTEGQIYSPEVNFMLMILCLAVVFGFGSATEIGNAFGVAVVSVMVITTCLITIVMIVIWGTWWPYVLVFFIVLISVEGCYLSAVLLKIPQGGWLPFVIAILFTLVMVTWNYGRQKKFNFETKNKLSKISLGHLLENLGNHRVPGICFFYTDLWHGIPPIVEHYVRNVRCLHQVLIFTSIRHIPVKTVLPAERFLVGRIGYEGVYRCVARYGYMDLLSTETTHFVDQVIDCLTSHIGSALDFLDHPDSKESDFDSMQKEIEMIKDSKVSGAVYVLGRSEFRIEESTSYFDTLFAGIIFPFLNSICRSPVSSLNIPHSNFLEVGMYYDLL